MFQCDFITGGCNTVYEGIDFVGDLIAYPCANQILLYNIHQLREKSEQGKILQGLHYRSQWRYYEQIIEDGVIAIFDWTQLVFVDKRQISNESLQQFEVIEIANNEFIFITLGIDGQVTILDKKLETQTSLSFGQNVMESVSAHNYGGATIIALSGVDQNIHLYQYDQKELLFLTSLRGHTRSVNALSFYQIGNDLILASGAKDNFTRLWKIYSNQEDVNDTKGVKTINLKNKAQIFVRLDSVLQGHNEEVSSLSWGKNLARQEGESEYILASGSFDHNIIIWVQDVSGVWYIKSRLGQATGSKNQIFGVRNNQDKLVASTYVGALCLWSQTQNNWVELPTVSGHFSYVLDLDYSDKGYYVSCSQDQTTRIWSQWLTKKVWCEISRPQIHGYDLGAVKILKQENDQLDIIISGGDEKIVRLFNPTPVATNFANGISKLGLKFNGPIDKTIDGQVVYKVGQEGVQQPLGLMNKQFEIPGMADEEGGEIVEVQTEQDQAVLLSNDIDYTTPPNDSMLTIRGLWPELNKLYGHGYEIVALASHKTIAASSCKSTTQEAARIIIWDTQNFKIIQQLQSHNYTVVQMKFSSTGRYLASVSKDRTLSLFEKLEGGYQLKKQSQPAQRIMYTCDFTADEKYVLTGSRDKKIRVYDTDNLNKLSEFSVGVSVNALATFLSKDKNYVVVGLENGDIILLKTDFKEFEVIDKVQPLFKPNGPVNRIITVLKGDKVEVACCSDDHTVRIFTLTL